MPYPSFKDVLLRGLKQENFIDVSNMPDKGGLEMSKPEHHSTGNSYKSVDRKKLNFDSKAEHPTSNSKLNWGSKGEQSVSNSYKGLDWKTLNTGIWSLNPITLNVTPGDKVILEDILLDKDGKVKHASLVKVVQYIYIYIYELSSMEYIKTLEYWSTNHNFLV